MAAKGLAIVGDTVQGTCPLYHALTQGPESFTGVWGSIAIPNRQCTVAGIPLILIGDTGQASCGHTFRALHGGQATMPGGSGVHRTGDDISIVENNPNAAVGITIVTPSICTSN